MLSDLPHHLAVILALSHEVAAGYRRRRRTPSRSSHLEFAATASPASAGGSAPRRALGAPRFQEACFVAVASDAGWQFGRARKTSLRDRHAVRLSKLPDVAALALEWPSTHDSSTVVETRLGLMAQ